MSENVIRQRGTQLVPTSLPDLTTNPEDRTGEAHPAGKVRHGGPKQILRSVLFVLYFVICVCTMGATQYIGSPLYYVNKDYFYAYMAMTKQSFGLFITTLCQWWSPTLIRISWDRTMDGQMRLTKDGRLECSFPERIVLIANHQLYTDWLYLWWIAYTNRMHGHIYIILKESLKYIPVVGQGMMFYGFVFLARNWAKDKARFAYRLQKLKTRHSGPMSGSQSLDPMWMLIFPEGTNLSHNGRNGSAKWAAKQGIKDYRHELIPRSTGLLYCLKELEGTVDWVYDCTLAYEGVPRGKYGQDFFTLRSSFIQGRPPKSVNMYWRRFPVSSIPLEDPKAFEDWLRDRWLEKDDLMEMYMQSGRFPANKAPQSGSSAPRNVSSEEDKSSGPSYLETEARQSHWWEVGEIFVVLGGIILVGILLAKMWNSLRQAIS
ncbi:MAG: hypothetical protein M1837_000656 [Sclerophora amabilis]|nr:MAG: hypothetical protein M1837_000656 [Sclerophora amabilis]